MHIEKIEIFGYKSLLNCSLELDPFATILMGRNDVGKSNILSALIAFGSRTPFASTDRCRHASEDTVPQIIVHYTGFSDADLEALAGLPSPIKPKTSLSITRRGDNASGYSIQVDGKDVNSIDSSTPQQAESPPEPVESDQASPSDAQAQPRVLTPPGKIQTLLWAILPSIALFKPASPLQAQITLEQLKSADPSFETARRLLQLAGVRNYSDLASDDLAAARDYRIEVSKHLSNLIQKHWNQDSDLALQVDYQAPYIIFLVSEATPRSTYPEQHSPATNEFLAILADFLLQLEEPGEQHKVLLMDEPGISLHPGGKKDLLSLIRGFSRSHQVIFTSHSPHLIDRNYPGQIRLVKKTSEGTVVDNKPHTSQEPFFVLPYEPIRSAIGVGIGDALFFDEKNLIVEGPSDQIIIGALSQALAEAGSTSHLDLNNTAIIPAGSAGNIEIMSRMALARDLSVVALFDSDDPGKTEAQRLIKKHANNEGDVTAISEHSILIVEDAFPDKKPRCTEDLLPRKLYLEGVNSLYSRVFHDWKQLTLKTSGIRSSEPIAKSISLYFDNELKGEYGDFDKVRVARELACMIRDLEMAKADGKVRIEFQPIAKLFDLFNQSMEGGEPERVPPTKDEKASSTKEKPSTATKKSDSKSSSSS